VSLRSLSIRSVWFSLLLALLIAPAFSQEQQPAPQQPTQQTPEQTPQQAPQQTSQQTSQQAGEQQSASGEQEVRYTAEEYAAYQKAVEQPDPAARADAIIAFVKANPQSSLVSYAISAYEQLMQDYQAKGETQKLAAAGEKLLSVRPGDLRVMYATGLAFFQTEQFSKAAPLLEKVYEKQPEPDIAFRLAIANGTPGLGNNDKLIKYGEIACAQYPPAETYRILTQMTRAYSEKRMWIKAGDTAKKSLQALTEAAKPASVSQADWDDYVNREKAVAYSAIGRQAIEKGNLAAALENYKKSLSTYSKLPALQAEAYYQIGIIYWKSNSAHWAMVAFAKGQAIKGVPQEKWCRQQLETMYSYDHNGSLAGLSDFIDQALHTPLP
jgi:tetratricopeptide (TPR) repeat protein